jgi:hydroxyacylglutathione hydrolase
MNITRFVVGVLATNAYILKNENDLAIIDPGAEAEFLASQIKEKLGELKYIILTHFHFDHSLGVVFLKKNFPNAKILIHQDESTSINHYFDGLALNFGPLPEKSSDIEKETFVDFKPDRLLKDGDVIEIGNETLSVIHTPGHSGGSICLLTGENLFSGDTIFADGIGRTDLPGSSPSDMEKSLRKLKKIIKPGTKVHPGHGELFIYS